MLVCAGACVCLYARVYTLRIVSTDKVLRFINTSTILASEFCGWVLMQTEAGSCKPSACADWMKFITVFCVKRQELFRDEAVGQIPGPT